MSDQSPVLAAMPSAPYPNDVSAHLGRVETALWHIHLMLHAQSEVLQCLTRKVDYIMAVTDDLKVILKDLDAETTDIATNIANMAAKIKNSMTDAEVSDIKSGFGTLGDRLKTLAADPTVPVPPVPPPLAALRKKV